MKTVFLDAMNSHQKGEIYNFQKFYLFEDQKLLQELQIDLTATTDTYFPEISKDVFDLCWDVAKMNLLASSKNPTERDFVKKEFLELERKCHARLEKIKKYLNKVYKEEETNIF